MHKNSFGYFLMLKFCKWQFHKPLNFSKTIFLIINISLLVPQCSKTNFQNDFIQNMAPHEPQRSLKENYINRQPAETPVILLGRKKNSSRHSIKDGCSQFIDKITNWPIKSTEALHFLTLPAADEVATNSITTASAETKASGKLASRVTLTE